MAANYKQYHKETEAKNEQLLQSVLGGLPPYCKKMMQSLEQSKQVRTRLGYARDLQIFFYYLTQENPLCKDKEAKDISIEVLKNLSRDDIFEYLRFLSNYEKDGIMHSNDRGAKARKLSALNRLYNYLNIEDYFQGNPLVGIEWPRIKKKNLIALDPEQVNMLLSKIASGGTVRSNHQKSYYDRTQLRDIAIVMTFLGTGIRISELVGLNLSDVDLRENSLRVVRKGGNEDIVYFSEDVADALLSYAGYEEFYPLLSPLPSDQKTLSPRQQLLKKGDPKEQALFISMQGKRMAVRSVQEMIKKYCSVIPNKHITPHKLRSTYANNLYEKTGDIYLTGNALGHRSTETTKRYAGVSDRKKKSIQNISLYDSNSERTD